MTRSLPVLLLGLLLAACGVVSTTSDAAGGIGGPLCDMGSQTSLEGLSTQLDGFSESTDAAALLAAALTTRDDLQEMTAGSDEVAEWRDASIDALNQLERRIEDPERLPNVANHAARTLRGLASRVCS